MEYIVPSQNWKHEKFSSKTYNEAIDLIAKAHFPSVSERDEVHKKIENLVSNGLPDWFFLEALRNVKNPSLYPIYPDKFNERTWRLLREKMLVKFNHLDSDYYSSPYLGLTIMALLAETCAGKTKRKITDRTEAYSWLQQHTTVQLGGEYLKGLDASEAVAYERLVTLSIKLLNTDDIPISALVDMRKREAKSSSTDYRKFRMAYLKKVDEYVSEISKYETKSDVIEIERQFKKDMESDLKELRKELKLSNKQLLFSKEVGVAFVASIGSLATHISGLTDLASIVDTLGVGALIRAGIKRKADRTKILQSNAMSWLYLNEKRSTRFDPRKIII